MGEITIRHSDGEGTYIRPDSDGTFLMFTTSNRAQIVMDANDYNEHAQVGDACVYVALTELMVVRLLGQLGGI